MRVENLKLKIKKLLIKLKSKNTKEDLLLQKVMLIDRPNGMRFAREMIRDEQMDEDQLELHEADFFRAVPAADVFVISNTAHDWQPQDYSLIIGNIREVIPSDGTICIHEPLLLTSWDSDTEWVRALWMACYALTLFRLTLGAGTCYTIAEHHGILSKHGFQPSGMPMDTCDGCTALFYRYREHRDD